MVPLHADLLHYSEDRDLLPSSDTAQVQEVLVRPRLLLFELIDVDHSPTELLYLLYHCTGLPNDMPNHITGDVEDLCI